MEEGDRVYIVGGIYSRYSMGTYIRPYGKKMCTISVDGDKDRNVRLTSIRKAPPETTTGTTGPTRITMTREEYHSLLRDIESLTMALDALHMKVKRYHHEHA
jgi:hypothetical protein